MSYPCRYSIKTVLYGSNVAYVAKSSLRCTSSGGRRPSLRSMVRCYVVVRWPKWCSYRWSGDLRSLRCRAGCRPRRHVSRERSVMIVAATQFVHPLRGRCRCPVAFGEEARHTSAASSTLLSFCTRSRSRSRHVRATTALPSRLSK